MSLETRSGLEDLGPRRAWDGDLPVPGAPGASRGLRRWNAILTQGLFEGLKESTWQGRQEASVTRGTREHCRTPTSSSSFSF